MRITFIMGGSRAATAGACHLHGQQPGQVDLRDGLGPLPLPHAALAVFGDLGVLAALHQMPQTQALLLLPLQHRRLCGDQTGTECEVGVSGWVGGQVEGRLAGSYSLRSGTPG